MAESFDIDMSAKECGLTENQKNFCINYVFISGLDPYVAYETAGYKVPDELSDSNKKKWISSNVMKLLGNPKVLKFIKIIRDEMENQIIVDKFWVIDKLKKLAEKGSEATQIKATELLGKTFSMFSDRQVIETAEDPGKLAKEAFEKRQNMIAFKQKEAVNEVQN